MNYTYIYYYKTNYNQSEPIPTHNSWKNEDKVTWKQYFPHFLSSFQFQIYISHHLMLLKLKIFSFLI